MRRHLAFALAATVLALWAFPAGPAFAATNRRDLIVSRGSIFRRAATSAIVRAFGVATSSRAPVGADRGRLSVLGP